MDTIDITDNEENMSTIPWEKRDKIGLLKAFLETVRGVLLRPLEFFDRLKIKDSYVGPLSFYFVVLLVTLGLSVFFYLFFPQHASLSITNAIHVWITWLVVMSLTIFIISAIAHVSAKLLGGQHNFKATFNIFAYISACNILRIIPFIGTFISLAWGIIIGVIGFKKVHKLNTAKALLTYLSPWLIMSLISLVILQMNPNIIRSKSCPYKPGQNKISNSYNLPTITEP